MRRLAMTWLLLGSAFAVDALAQPLDLHRVSGLTEPSARVASVDRATLAGIDAVLRDYAAVQTARPYDVLAWIDECDFIVDFIERYEDADGLDPVEERREACEAKLVERWGEHPEVRLRGLRQTYKDAERLAAGGKLLASLEQPAWTPSELARLYTLLAGSADRLNDETAVDYARNALELDDLADVRLLLAHRLLRHGDKAGAAEVIGAPLDGHDVKDRQYIADKITLLAELGLRDRVVATHAGLAEAKYYDHIQVARALRSVGEIDRARAELDKAPGVARRSTVQDRERFLLELAHGTPEQAQTAYARWRDRGWSEDPVGINRWALFLRAPLLPWGWRDTLGLLGACASVLVLAGCAAMPVAAVHYRGLARRVRTNEPYPRDGWRLGHAWFALFAIALASFLALYTVGPVDLDFEVPRRPVALDPIHWSRVLIAYALFALALLWPIGRAAAAAQPNCWARNWSIPKALLIGAAIAVVSRLPLLLLVAFARDRMSWMFDDEIWRLIGAVSVDYGAVAALWAAALAAPVIEELVFRGVLLGAFSRHLSFGWANALQAALFSALHFNLRFAIVLFLLGALLGWLARRSGGLVAPIALHGLFNLLGAAALLIVRR